MSTTFTEALVRALILSVATGIGAWAPAFGVTQEWPASLAAGAGAAAAAFLVRFGGEGTVDTKRASNPE